MTDDSEPMRVPEEQAGSQSEPQGVSQNLPAIRRPRLAERIAMARRALPPADSVEICEEIQTPPMADVADAAEVHAPAEPAPSAFNEVQAVAPEILARYLLPPDDAAAADARSMNEPASPVSDAFVAPDTDAPPLTLAELFAEISGGPTDPASDTTAQPVVDEAPAPVVDEIAGSVADADAEPEAEPQLETVSESLVGPERPAYTPLLFEEAPAPVSHEPEPVSAAAAELVSLMDAQRTLLAEMMRLRTEGPAAAPVPEPLPMPMLPLTEREETDFDDEPPPMVLERAQAIHLAGGRALGRPLHEAPSRLPAFVGGMIMAAATAAAVYAWRVLG